jgi:hypothetical protein
MSFRWLGSISILAASAGLTLGQAPLPVGSGDPRPLPSAAGPLMVNGTPGPVVPIRTAAPDKAVAPAASVTTMAVQDFPPPPIAATAAAVAAPPTTSVPAGPSQYIPAVPDHRSGPRFYGRADYLLWFVKKSDLAPIYGTVPEAVLSSGLGGIPPGSIDPAFGGKAVDYHGQSGFRAALGFTADEAGDVGFEAEFFQLTRGALHSDLRSDAAGNPPLGPVFNDPVAGNQTIVFLAQPGVATGGVAAALHNRLWGADLDARFALPTVFSSRSAFLIGYRHVNFDESLDVSGDGLLALTTPSSFAGATYYDGIGIHNRFDGAEIGLDLGFDHGPLFLELRGKFGMGNNRETSSVQGATNIISTDPTSPSQTLPGGVLSQPSNIGRFSRDRFSVLGEITVNTGVHITDRAKFYVGYDFLGLSKVARVADLIDGTDAKGLNVGLQFEY